MRWIFLLLSGVFSLTVSALDAKLKKPFLAGGDVQLTVTYEGADSVVVGFANGTYLTANESGEVLTWSSERGGAESVVAISYLNGQVLEKKKVDMHSMPGWLSILPPLIAILLAILLKEVLVSLFAGIVAGVMISVYYTGGGLNPVSAFFYSTDQHIIPALYDTGHLSVIVFSLVIGGMVAVISKNGGMAGLVVHIAKYARTPRSAQLVTWALGIIIFFDDYANTLVVGNTMRPLTDRLRISRAKLSYLVDSTAAPVASIAFVTTWIGAQLGYIQDGIDSLDGLNQGAYSVFIQSLQYAFYPILTILFMFILIWVKKDFGPMHQSEIRARREETYDTGGDGEENELKALEPLENTPRRAFNAIVPVSILVVGTILALFYTGWDAGTWNSSEYSTFRKLSLIIGQADSYRALLWSSFLALGVALLLTITQGIMKLTSALHTMMKGFGFMLQAIIILTFAWTLSGLTEQLHTADYITGTLIELEANPVLLPALTFVLSALVSFSTGSSWSTMAILYPIILPATWLLCEGQGMESADALAIFYNVVSCVLAGSVMGDHCSPISDTTILSSLASSCNHLEHVRTQMPYALTVGSVSLILGTIPAAMGIPAWVCFLVGILAIYLIIRIFGKNTEPNN